MAAPKDIADPFTAWREWISESERQWNGFLNEAMATEEFSRSMGQFMEMYLNYQKGTNEAMGRYFSSLNVASRTDVLTLGERLTTVEEKLDTLIRKLDDVALPTRETSGGSANADRRAASRPPRTRRSPAADTT